MNAGNIITLIIAGLTFIGTWLTIRANRARSSVENTKDLTVTALSLIRPLEERIDHLEDELAEQRERRYKLEARVETLENFIRLNTEFDPEHIQ